MSAGIAKAWYGLPGAVSAHAPGTARTATAAVRRRTAGRTTGRPGPAVSSAMPGLCPIRSAVRHSAAELADQHQQAEHGRLVHPGLVADRRVSARRGGPQPGGGELPGLARPQRRRADHRVRRVPGLAKPAADRGRVPLRPRLASGRSWSATSGQSDLACLSRTSRSTAARRPSIARPGRSRDHRHRPLARPDQAHRQRPEQPVAGLERGADDDGIGPRLLARCGRSRETGHPGLVMKVVARCRARGRARRPGRTAPCAISWCASSSAARHARPRPSW